MIAGINHLTLAVRDLDRALHFYVDLLGCRPQVRWARGAYLLAGELWLCLSFDDQAPDTPVAHYSHFAFSVADADFPALRERLRAANVREWQDNRSEGASLYLLDPDQHKLELHVGDLSSRLRALRARPYDGLQWLDAEPSQS